MNAGRIRELEAVIADARAELSRLQDAADAEAASALIGKCYTYRNSFASGVCWPLYTRIVGQENGRCRVMEFERRADGSLEARPDGGVRYGHFLAGGSHTEIPPAEWRRAWQEFLAAVAALGVAATP